MGFQSDAVVQKLELQVFMEDAMSIAHAFHPVSPPKTVEMSVSGLSLSAAALNPRTSPSS